MQSEQINELTAAMAKANSVIENATLNKINPHFKSKYADLAAIFDAIRKPLAANGLVPIQTTEIRDGAFVLVTTLAHSSGQWIRSEYPLPANGRPQEVGSALTYAKRYALSALVGIAAEEDDDANAAENGHRKTVVPAKPMPPAPPIEPPADPQTGEIGPHKIEWTGNPVEWGGKYIAAIKSCAQQSEIVAWEEQNAYALKEIEATAPKAYRSIQAAKNIRLDAILAAKEAAE